MPASELRLVKSLIVVFKGAACAPRLVCRIPARARPRQAAHHTTNLTPVFGFTEWFRSFANLGKPLIYGG